MGLFSKKFFFKYKSLCMHPIMSSTSLANLSRIRTENVCFPGKFENILVYDNSALCSRSII